MSTELKRLNKLILSLRKQTIIDLHSKGVNKCQLADMSCISKRTVYCIIQRFQATDSIENFWTCRQVGDRSWCQLETNVHWSDPSKITDRHLWKKSRQNLMRTETELCLNVGLLCNECCSKQATIAVRVVRKRWLGFGRSTRETGQLGVEESGTCL